MDSGAVRCYHHCCNIGSDDRKLSYCCKCFAHFLSSWSLLYWVVTPESHPTRIQSSICYKSISTVALLHRRHRWIGQEKSSWSWSTTIFCSLYGAWLVATRYSSATSGGQLSGPLSGRSCCVYGVNLEDLIWNKFYFSTTTAQLRDFAVRAGSEDVCTRERNNS